MTGFFISLTIGCRRLPCQQVYDHRPYLSLPSFDYLTDPLSIFYMGSAVSKHKKKIGI
ncbi:hypothetical protein HMPREF0083_03097 [Aneurinibacillus aneurinilyticus ATCC 12856]|uniref:Uncharacterized protein n=1 Tax=Aneurinibacillus aneurinilyticus ATCC 12856 TaxID=649747 RepID=U1X1I1_ANEAE|nr:hypothetical protein HMPREF0083_03097 [Aneurinibacillus aneurinilyticus ATCC 12856]